MPRAYKMTWQEAKKRWVKMFKGQMFIVSCHQLNPPLFTKEHSYKLANAWWEAKLAELTRTESNEQERRNRYPLQDLEERSRKAREELRITEQMIHELAYKPEVEQGQDFLSVRLIPDSNASMEGFDALAEKIDARPVEKVRTLEHQAKRFLAFELSRGKAPATYSDLAYFVDKVVNRLGGQLDIATINEQTVTDFYSWLRGSKMALNSQHKCFGNFRRLVRFFADEKLIEQPRNLDRRQFTFDRGAVVVKQYPTEEVREMLGKIPERLRLYALLSLNCGFTAVDIGHLRQSELQGNYIIRKRSKTKKREKVPTVQYLLWEETRVLLEKYRSTHPEFVLTSGNATPLWRREIVDGKEKKVNLIWCQWYRDRDNKPGIPLKVLRSVSATLLRSNKHYADLRSHFLGHAPTTIADRHYSAPPQDLFNEAVMWLREQLLG